MVRMVLIHIVVCHPAYSIGITFFEIDLSFQKGHDNCVMRNYGTVQLFGTAGQAKMFSPGTKGQRGKLKILPRDGPGRDSQNSGRDGAGQQKSGTGRGTKRDRAENDVLKQEMDVLKQERMF